MRIKFIIIFILASISLTTKGQNIILSEGSFKINNSEFIPVGVNFAMGFKLLDNGEIYFNIAKDQCKENNCGTTKEELNNNLISLITEIENKGFNTLRIAGFAMYKNDFNKDISFPIYKDSKQLSIEVDDFTPYINAIERAVEIIEDNSNLKIIIITGSHGVDDVNIRGKYTNYLKQLKVRLEDFNSIFAYDIYNEPPFFTVTSKYEKCEIADMTHEWYAALTGRHLVTIGLFGTLDLFQFDPEVVCVDFINFHIFPYLLEWNNFNYEIAKSITARNYKWYARNVRKPWIIGETAFPGSDYHNSTNLSIGTEYEQEEFAKYTINAVKASGGLGIIWWQYSEVDWYNMNEDGPKARNNCYGIRYSNINNVPEEFAFNWKKASNIIPAFQNLSNPTFNISNNDYYNPKRYNYKGVTGIVTDVCNNPIVDAQIIVNYKYTKNDIIIKETNESFSDENGYFEIFSPNNVYEVIAFKITATGYSYIKLYNEDIEKKNFYEFKLNKIPEICIQNKLKNKTLFNIFPNPSKNYINIINKNDNTNIETIDIINNLGKKVLSIQNCNYDKKKNIPISNIPRGLYIIRIKHTWGYWSKKIIIL